MAEIHVRDFTLAFQDMQKRHADEVLAATCEIARDWEDFAREHNEQHGADQKAAEDLLAEAQARIEQKDKHIAVLEHRLAEAESLAEHHSAEADAFAEEADELEDEVEELEAELDAATRRWWFCRVIDLLFVAGLAVCIAGACGAFK